MNISCTVSANFRKSYYSPHQKGFFAINVIFFGGKRVFSTVFPRIRDTVVCLFAGCNMVVLFIRQKTFPSPYFSFFFGVMYCFPLFAMMDGRYGICQLFHLNNAKKE